MGSYGAMFFNAQHRRRLVIRTFDAEGILPDGYGFIL